MHTKSTFIGCVFCTKGSECDIFHVFEDHNGNKYLYFLCYPPQYLYIIQCIFMFLLRNKSIQCKKSSGSKFDSMQHTLRLRKTCILCIYNEGRGGSRNCFQGGGIAPTCDSSRRSGFGTLARTARTASLHIGVRGGGGGSWHNVPEKYLGSVGGSYGGGRGGGLNIKCSRSDSEHI